MGGIATLFHLLMETVCDLSSNHLQRRPTQGPHSTVHRLEAVAATLPRDTVADAATPEVATTQAYRCHQGMTSNCSC